MQTYFEVLNHKSSWRNWVKPWKQSDKTVGVPTEIRARKLPNTSQKRYRFTQVAQSECKMYIMCNKNAALKNFQSGNGSDVSV
jgi:hypothetical protein